MKKPLALSLVFSALTVLPALAQGAPQLPAPKILVINRSAILQFSKVGQDISRQVQAYANQAKSEISAQGRALETESQALQQQIAILAPEAKRQKIQAFENKRASLQAAAQRREQAIQGGVMRAQQTVEQTLAPILMGLMQQRGANMILDKNAVVFANSGAFDITQAAVDQLNAKLSSVKVTLAAAPAPAPAKK